jgi:hypothetical protein
MTRSADGPCLLNWPGPPNTMPAPRNSCIRSRMERRSPTFSSVYNSPRGSRATAPFQLSGQPAGYRAVTTQVFRGGVLGDIVLGHVEAVRNYNGW